jgi:hypothetical protein
MPYGTLNADTITNSNGLSGNAIGPGFKNRIINGDMRIDQRNAGASVSTTTTGSTVYTLDRWSYAVSAASKFTIQQSTTAATGFVNSALVTSSSAYTVLTNDYFVVSQFIEGTNVADLAWGTANAKTVTLSFWVRSSLTGTFGGALQNSAQNRAYPFTYAISAANTWEQKSITISGDTSGTWLTDTGAGIRLRFGLGVGTTYSGTAGAWAGAQYFSATGATQVVATNGATFYVTGVQLEVAPSATSFDYRPFGTELALCQRYYFKIKPGSPGYYTTLFSYVTNSDSYGGVSFPVPMRIAPTALEQTGTASDYSQAFVGAGGACTGVPVFTAGTTVNVGLVKSVASSGHTAGQAGYMYASNSNSYLAWSAEL